MKNAFTLNEFLEDFIYAATHAKKRIWIQSMVLAEGHVMSRIEPLLRSARERGVDVRVQFDWVTFRYYHGDIDLFPGLSLAKRAKFAETQAANRALFDRLRNYDITINIINRPNLLQRIIPISGRNHMKLYIIDDVAWFGGLNLYDESFDKLDFMVKYDEPAIVNAFKDQFPRINAERLPEDRTIPLTDMETLYIDSGKRNRSLILNTAIDMVDQARKSVIFASQMVPEGRLLRGMLAAVNRGVQVTVYTSPHDDSIFTAFPKNIPYGRFLHAIRNTPTLKVNHLSQKLHMKLLIVDDTFSLFGSHNLVDTGVWLGTEEIAIRTSRRTEPPLQNFIPTG